jgi:hypothetical protein
MNWSSEAARKMTAWFGRTTKLQARTWGTFVPSESAAGTIYSSLRIRYSRLEIQRGKIHSGFLKLTQRKKEINDEH